MNQPENEDLAVGGRLSHYASHWAHVFGEQHHVAQNLAQGIRLKFTEKPPLTRHPVDFVSRNSLDALQSAVQMFLEKKVIVPVREKKSLGFYSRLFLVPKKSGEDRPVIDLSHLNTYLDVPRFRMETPQAVRNAIRPGEWVTSVDISDAYLHVPMAPSAQRFLRFKIGKEVFQFQALPFGLATAPREFTLIMRPIVQILRAHGVRIHAYLDDWLIRADSPDQARLHTNLVVNLLQYFGWKVNFKKSHLEPTQDFVFLGMHFRTGGPRVLVSPTVDQQMSLISRLQQLESNPTVTARQLYSLMGIIRYMAPLVPQGFLHLRPLQWEVKSLWDAQFGDWSDLVLVPVHVRRMMAFWTGPSILDGVPAYKDQTTISLCTDASLGGWGAIVSTPTGTSKASGVWSPQEKRCHINALEIMAVTEALQELGHLMSNKSVRLLIDNRTAVSYLSKQGGTRSRTLNDLALMTLGLAAQLRIELHPVYISTSHNVGADALSRRGQTLETEWCLKRALVQDLFRKWGHPQVDLFATPENAVLKRFYCPYPCHTALAMDALSVSWDNLGFLYAFPPFKIIPEVLRKFRASKNCSMILIAPNKSNYSWTPELMSLCKQQLLLPRTPDLLFQLTRDGCQLHKSPAALMLTAWLL